MQTSGQAHNLAGSLSCKRFTITNNDCTAAATTQTIALFTLPKGSVVVGYRIKHNTAFAGTAITSVTVSIGTSSMGSNGIANAFNILQAVAAGTFGAGSCFKFGPDADEAVNAYLTSVGGNLSAMTAGSVDVEVYFFLRTTPQ